MTRLESGQDRFGARVKDLALGGLGEGLRVQDALITAAQSVLRPSRSDLFGECIFRDDGSSFIMAQTRSAELEFRFCSLRRGLAWLVMVRARSIRVVQ